MSGQARLDPLKFARDGASLHGKIAASELPRLRDVLASQTGSIEYRLEGTNSQEGKPQLVLWLGGELQLICQRCLEPMPWPVHVASRFVLVESEAELGSVEDEDPGVTEIVAEPPLDVPQFVEDELILALPMAPTHPQGGCGPQYTGNNERGQHHPFAGLAALKRKIQDK